MRVALLLVFALAAVPTRADSPGAIVTPARLAIVKKDLAYLAGPECEGRGTETEGIKKAGVYIAEQFKAAGLKPAGTDGFFQPFSIRGPARLGTPNRLTLARPDAEPVELAYGKDFVPTGLSAGGKATGGLAFVGYGITAPTLDYDDYAGIDAAGKVVVILRRTPQAEKQQNAFNELESVPAALATKVALAAKNKAKAVVFVNDQGYARNGDPLLDFRSSGGAPGSIPVVHMKRKHLEALLARQGVQLAEWEAGVDKSLKPNSVELKGEEATVEATIDSAGLPTRNVVAVSEGSGPLADETIVVGAHYDHLGFGESGSLAGRAGKGEVHYGADDNGSGTVGLLELARRVGGMANRKGRRIVFVAFAGEERGLFGSIHYCQEPPFPLADTVFMLNMDMIGRVIPAEVTPGGPTKDRVVVYGHGTAEGLESVVDAITARLDMLVLKVPGGTGPSDHDSFYKKKIPVLFFFTGLHPDYHRPSDTPDKVNYEGLLKVVAFAETAMLYAATTPARPKYLVTKGGFEDPTAPKRPTRPRLPKLGVVFGGDDNGVAIETVAPDGAAERARLKPGDVIVKVGASEVSDLESFLKAMQNQRANVETDVVVVRGGKRVTVKVTPLP